MSGLPKDLKRPGFEAYFAAGSLSFGLVWIISEVFSAILSHMGYVAQELEKYVGVWMALAYYILLRLGCGWLGGYFVSRMAANGHVRAGLLTGFAAFAIEFVITMVFQQFLFPGAIWALLGFLAGGLLGGLTVRFRRSRTTSPGATSTAPSSPT